MASFSRLLTDATGFGFLYEKGSTHASANHQLDASVYTTLQPRLAFQYYVNFNLTQAGADALSKVGLDQYAVDGIEPLVKSVTMPSFEIESELLNQYDKPIVSQHKLSHEPVKIVMYDTVNGATLKLWQAYYEYYFKDSVLPTELSESESSEFGYNLNNVGNNKNFFDSIEIAMVNGSRKNTIFLFNPRIVSFDHDNMTYEKSQLVELTYTLEYEYAVYDTNNQLMEDVDLEKYRKGKFLDLPGLAISVVLGNLVGNLFAGSNNPIIRQVGGFAQDLVRGTSANLIGGAIRQTGTSVLDALGDISPRPTYSAPATVVQPRSFVPRI